MYTGLLIAVVSLWSFKVFIVFGCQILPSEYAFRTSSVYNIELPSANCREYPPGGTLYDLSPELYTHCEGTQLRLTDSKYGSEQYSSSDYYVLTSGSTGCPLLFIFPTKVNLTTITLHYYSDNTRGLPRLSFYAVPDDFEVWNALSASYSHVDIAAVPPGEELAGLRNVSINVNFRTVKMLLYMYISVYAFPLSEVKYSTCNKTMMQTTTVLPNSDTTDSEIVLKMDAVNTTNSGDLSTTSINQLGKQERTVTEQTKPIVSIISTGVVIATVILLTLTTIIAILLVYLRRSAQRNKDNDTLYSTLCRESGQQMQSQSLHTSNDLYDQIQLSPSTGQAEFISRNETANTNSPPPHQTEYGIHPSVDKDKPKSAKLKITASTTSTQDEDKSTSEQPTYAVVNKKRKQKTKNESAHCPSQDIAAVSQNEGVTEQNAVEHGSHDQESQDSPDTTMQFPSQTIDSPQALYTAVKKSPKDRPAEDIKVPTILPYTTEELYTAVKKTPHASTAGDDEEAPQIPPHTIEELYTAVQKKPKANATVIEEEAPPIPAHTVEELYTAVVKKPKASRAEDEEEAPPIPPHTVDEL